MDMTMNNRCRIYKRRTVREVPSAKKQSRRPSHSDKVIETLRSLQQFDRVHKRVFKVTFLFLLL